MIETDIRELNEKIQKESAFIDIIRLEMDKVIIGQKSMVERLLIGLLSNGHICLKVCRVWRKPWQLIVLQMSLRLTLVGYNLRPTYCLPTFLVR